MTGMPPGVNPARYEHWGKTTDIEDTFPYQRLEFLSVSARASWDEASGAR